MRTLTSSHATANREESLPDPPYPLENLAHVQIFMGRHAFIRPFSSHDNRLSVRLTCRPPTTTIHPARTIAGTSSRTPMSKPFLRALGFMTLGSMTLIIALAPSALSQE